MTRVARGICLTCEHGGNDVPSSFRHLFRDCGDVLESHRGWDPGTLDLARTLAASLDAALIASTVTRLLVDLNRSARNPRVFSEWTRRLPEEERRRLLARHHTPHRNAVTEALERLHTEGRRAVHVAVHSFTPTLDGIGRNADIGLLYDPGRALERGLAQRWAEALRARLAGWSVRRNYPYRGVSDGLTTWLRTRMAEDAYVGIELEINQRHLNGSGRFPVGVGRAVSEALIEALDGNGS